MARRKKSSGDAVNLDSLMDALTNVVAVLILGSIVNFLAGKLVSRTGLGGTDKLLGVVFGVARGGIIVAILVLLGGLTPFPQDPWWQESQFLGYFEEFAMWMRNYLPGEIADNITFA